MAAADGFVRLGDQQARPRAVRNEVAESGLGNVPGSDEGEFQNGKWIGVFEKKDLASFSIFQQCLGHGAGLLAAAAEHADEFVDAFLVSDGVEL